MSRTGTVSCCGLQHTGVLPLECPSCRRVHWRARGSTPVAPASSTIPLLWFAAALVALAVLADLLSNQ